MTNSFSQALNAGLDHHRAGRLQAAEAIYRQVLETDADNPHVWQLLGTIDLQCGRSHSAARCFLRALELNPGLAEVHNSLGNAFQVQGRVGEAAVCFERAIALQPASAEWRYNLANVRLQQGRTADAIEGYQQALERDDTLAAAHNNLGTALQAEGKHEEAIDCFQRALRLNPELVETNNNLGNAWRELGRMAEAAECFRRVVQLSPGNVAALYDLAGALQEDGQLAAAIECYQGAAELDPNNPTTHRRLGQLWQRSANPSEAAACFERSHGIEPSDAGTLSDWGVALREQGQLAAAIARFGQALALAPEDPQILNNLGLAWHDLGQLHDAIACFQRAVRISPAAPLIAYNLGNSLLRGGRIEEAIASFRHALAISPDFAEAHNNLANALKALRRPSDAAVHYEQALRLKPGSAEIEANLGAALMDAGQLDQAMACYRRALARKPDYAPAHSNLLYAMHFDPAADAKEIYEEHCRFDRQHAAKQAVLIRPHDNDRAPERRLRVGYVSPDFRLHSQANFTVPLFDQHDHGQFEIFAYSDATRTDHITSRLRSGIDVWKDTAGFSDERLAEQIRQDRIDVLVDLTMHLTNNRALLFARKPAPVQVCWLAYQGTTGLSAMDYRLTDPHLDPPGLDDTYYTEESIRLPDSFWCYDPLAAGPDVNPLPAQANGHITFGSLNNFVKVNSSVVALWRNTLAAIPNSRLWLLAPEGPERECFVKSFAEGGIAPDRIRFFPFLPRAKYLELYHGIDIGLDTFPYNGQTTSLDAYWLGVPVVTVLGKTAAARAGASLLMNLGLPELIAGTPDQFVQIAAELASDLPRLARLRATLRKRLQESPLMDAPKFARSIEAAYRMMWQRWCRSANQ